MSIANNMTMSKIKDWENVTTSPLTDVEDFSLIANTLLAASLLLPNKAPAALPEVSTTTQLKDAITDRIVEAKKSGNMAEANYWDMMQATARIESSWNKDAFNPRGGGKGAVGLFQIRMPVINDVNKRYGTNYKIEDAYNINKAAEIYRLYYNIQVGYLKHYKPGVNTNLIDISKMYNQGCGVVTKKASNESKTAGTNYWNKIKSKLYLHKNFSDKLRKCFNMQLNGLNTTKTELEEYTGLSRSDLYDKGSGEHRKCIWKLGDLVRTPDNIRSRDSGCYGKIVDIRKEVINEPGSSSDGDSYWLCYYKIIGPNAKANMIGKEYGYRDYCLLPYIPYKIKSNFSKSIHERLIRVLIRRRPDLNYSDEELKENGVTKQELVTYKNIHPEILDSSDDNSLANFSKKDFTGSSFKIDTTEGSHYGVFDSEGDCIYEGESKQDCIDYCNKNKLEYKIKSNFSERINKIFK